MEPSPEDVILEEEIDPNYEPTEEELVEYATWLGMDLIKHKNLLWIAKEALIAPLPNDWKPCLTEEDEIYYFNFTTGRSIWDHPCDEYYRKVYKEEVEKLNQLQQGDQAFINSSTIPRDQSSSQTVVESNSKSLQMDRVGDSQSSLNSSERVSERDHIVDSKNSFMSCFPRDSSSTSQSNNITRSLPPPHLRGHPALLNLKGGSFDSMIRLYAASLSQHGGGIPFADFFRMQEATGRLQLQRADNSVSTCSGHTHTSHEKRMWVQGDDKRELEKKISQIKDRIERKLVDEERVVLQQERVEMLERVCKQVQDEESQILDSLRREIIERMERNIREETQALLAKRRKEIVEEVEHEMRAEKLVLMESRGNQDLKQEKRSLENDTKANVSTEGSKPQELETSLLETKRPNTNKELIEKQLPLNERDGTSIEQMEREEVPHVKTPRENESLSKGSCPEIRRGGAQNMQRPTTKAEKSFVEHDEEDVIVRDSSQNVETECREKRFEKSFHVQDLQTSLLLKLEILMKIGTSSD